MGIATMIIARLMPIWIIVFAIWAIFSPDLFKGWNILSRLRRPVTEKQSL
jgi:uncharacterized membrane protein